jgi:hypothetical protein
MDITLQQCEREIFREYEEKVRRLNELTSETPRYRLVHIRGRTGARDLKVQVLTSTGETKHVLGLEFVDRKLKSCQSRRPLKDVTNFASQTNVTADLNKVLFETIQLISKFRNQARALNSS